jgi:chromosomal replication initiation ATPase DnaA
VKQPRQLILDLASRPALGREDFLVSPSNEAAYGFVEAWPAWPGRSVLLTGPAGAGKSHLAAIWAAEAGAVTVEGRALATPVVPDLVKQGAVVVEAADAPSGDDAALFHLLNLAREREAWLLLTARSMPGDWGVTVPDLLSRLRALPTVSIGPPDEALLRSLLVKLFVDRQLVVDTSVVDFLALHLDRTFEAARAIVTALDREALSRGRRVTRAMAADLIDASSRDESDT